MQCFWPHLARLALRRPAHSLTSSALGLSIRAQPTCLTTSIPFLRPPGVLYRAESTTAAAMAYVLSPSSLPPPSTTQRDAQAGWKLCQTIRALVRDKELRVALRDCAKLPLSSISPRRSSHVILHGLIRKGLLSEASFYAQHSVNRGINVHKHSLQAIVLGMVRAVEAQPPAEDMALTVPLNAPTILKLAPATNQNPDIIRSALALYEAERMSGKRRSTRLFKYLMVLCILNGEIILASLLFGTIMREWQARDMANRDPGNAPSIEPAPKALWTTLQVRQMCHFMKEFLTTDCTDPTSQVLHNSSLQALAQLAYMLDHDQLPYGGINFLIKTMLLCPRGPARVWIPGDSPGERPQYVNAYMYIHDVLGRLIDNLPKRGRHIQEDRHANFTWLTGQDYVKLIEYSLKHRHSLKATRKIMQHILEEDPDILNLRELQNVVLHASASFPKGVILNLMTEFRMPLVALDWDPSTTDYTYSTVINAMMKAGHSEAVMDAIPALLPGLFLPRYDESLSIDQNNARRMDLVEEGLRRGVTLGPVVFVCLMNAARSLGNTKFCERIFHFALAAQERSWKPEPGMKVDEPWCLPVHAYTIMVRLYAREMNLKTNDLAQMWGDSKVGEAVSRPVMGHRMVLATVRRMVKEARRLEERVKEIEKRTRASWLKIPYPDGFFFNALIEAFAQTPDDPVYAALKGEMEAEGFRPPAAYLKSLNIDPNLDGGSWRKPKDTRPFAFPEEHAYSETHAPALYTKKLPKRLKHEVD